MRLLLTQNKREPPSPSSKKRFCRQKSTYSWACELGIGIWIFGMKGADVALNFLGSGWRNWLFSFYLRIFGALLKIHTTLVLRIFFFVQLSLSFGFHFNCDLILFYQNTWIIKIRMLRMLRWMLMAWRTKKYRYEKRTDGEQVFERNAQHLKLSISLSRSFEVCWWWTSWRCWPSDCCRSRATCSGCCHCSGGGSWSDGSGGWRASWSDWIFPRMKKGREINIERKR